jgi:hypothetical protein
MGGHPYWYFVPYDDGVKDALGALREREFRAGRYWPVCDDVDFEAPEAEQPAPGPQHRSMRAALEAAAETGTRSILDIERLSNQADYSVAAPVDAATSRKLFGSVQPDRAAVERGFDELLERIERGQCLYVVIHEGTEPREILFAGHSYD